MRLVEGCILEKYAHEGGRQSKNIEEYDATRIYAAKIMFGTSKTKLLAITTDVLI